MALSKHIEGLKQEIKRAKVPSPVGSRAIAALDYFRIQALCDQDRRASPQVLQRYWKDFEQLCAGTFVFEILQRRSEEWLALKNFVGGQQIVALTLPPQPKHLKKFEGKDLDLLIEHLVREVEIRPTLSKEEVLLARFGLYYLNLEARRGRGQRDKTRIRFTWKVIQPVLRKIGVLDEIATDQEAVRKIKAFISDKFF